LSGDAPTPYFGFIEFVNAAGTGGWIIPSDLVTDEMRKALEEMGYRETGTPGTRISICEVAAFLN
jgi:hypothetical protein